MKSEALKEGISKAEEAWESDRLMYPGRGLERPQQWWSFIAGMGGLPSALSCNHPSRCH